MKINRIGFRITGGKGFHITFENRWTVSVQFGAGNYCQHHDAEIRREDTLCGKEGSFDAECAAWGEGGEMVRWDDWGDTVGGYMEPAKVLELMNWAAAQPDLADMPKAPAKARPDASPEGQEED